MIAMSVFKMLSIVNPQFCGFQLQVSLRIKPSDIYAVLRISCDFSFAAEPAIPFFLDLYERKL